LVDTLVNHPYVGRLKLNEYFMFVDLTKSLVKSTNILVTLKENDIRNVTTIKHVYNVRYTYKRYREDP